MVSRTLIRDLPDRSRVVVHLQLRERGDAGGLSPVFSVTTDRYEPHGSRSGKWCHCRDRDPDSGGCLHDAALHAFPELALLVDLHLADSETGEPMHAEANGLYFYRTARGLPGGWSDDYQHAEREGLTPAGYARRVACSILRVDEIPLDDVPEQDLAAAFHRFVEDQRERWQDEARAGRAQLQAIPTIYELRGYDAAGNTIERPAIPTARSCSDERRRAPDRSSQVACSASRLRGLSTGRADVQRPPKMPVRRTRRAEGQARAEVPMTLDDDDIEQIARRVAQLIGTAQAHPGPRYVDAGDLARMLGIERHWIYAHARELGAIRLGGPRGRLRFDVGRVAEAIGRPEVASRPARPGLPRRGSRAPRTEVIQYER